MADSKTMTVFVRADIKNLSTNMAKVDRTLKSVLGNNGMKLSKTFATGMLVATAAMGAFGLASVKMAADFQTTQKAFDVLLGDTDKAKKHLADLAQFAAQTPFELKGLTEASKKMLAFQFDVQDVIPILTAVGDAAAMLGSGQEGIDGMLLALEQIKAKGRAQGQEMLQLAERGVNAYQYLADYLETDIPGVMDLLQKGAVDSTTAINAVVMGMQKDFKGGMGVKEEADFQKLLAFFHNRCGKAYGFRFRDYMDYVGTLEYLGTGDGENKEFQLVKNYVDDVLYIAKVRKILKPVPGTVRVFLVPITEAFTWQKQVEVRKGVGQSTEQFMNWYVDVITGKITFVDAVPKDMAVLASYEFDVPVRFDTDSM